MWAWWTASAASASEGRRGPGIVLERREPLGEVAALDELHAEVALAVVLADLVDRDDAGVVEQRDGLGLVLEPAQLGVVGQDAGLDHLEGDGPVEADLAGLVDDAHAAAAQLLLDLVVAEVADGRARGIGEAPGSPPISRSAGRTTPRGPLSHRCPPGRSAGRSGARPVS